VIPPIVDNDKTHYTYIDKANAFNTFFVQQSTINDNNDNLPEIHNTDCEINQLLLDPHFVQQIINSLDSNKAVGPDKIHNIMLKASSPILINPLTKLFNRSLRSGVFPDSWKTAHVTPIHKKSDKNNCSNYRPISLLSCVGKLLERCVHHHILTYLKTNNLLTQSQSGFLPGDSTTNQLLCIYNDLLKSLDANCDSQAIFFDISKAFDKVWHKGLIHKIKGIGIRNHLLSWLYNYLSNRTQAVVIKGSCSSYLTVHAGVPQGSVLGPLLFLIYINDIVNDITSTTKLFADDTSIYLSLDNPQDRTDILNSDLTKITIWAKKWKISFSEPKTKLLNFSNKRTPTFLPLHFGTSILTEVDQHKHLGIILQTDCKWTSHINMIISKCRPFLACLRSFKHRLSRKALEILYKSFIVPHLDYCDVVWDNCTQEQASALEDIQLDAIRTITGTVRGTSHSLLYKESGIIPLTERRRRHKLKMFHKIIHDKTPSYIKKEIPPLITSTNPYHRRRPNDRLVPRCKHELYKNSFFPSTTYLWNKLPEYIQETNSLMTFNRHLTSPDLVVPFHFYTCHNRVSQEVHCKLRLKMSDLNHHKVLRHISNDLSCSCGAPIESNRHFLLECPQYTQSRNLTIITLPDELRTLNLLLSGNPTDYSVAVNQHIFHVVQTFISLSNRFT